MVERMRAHMAEAKRVQEQAQREAAVSAERAGGVGVAADPASNAGAEAVQGLQEMELDDMLENLAPEYAIPDERKAFALAQKEKLAKRGSTYADAVAKRAKTGV